MNGKRIAMGQRRWPVAVTAALILAAMIGGPVHAYLFNGSELVEYYNSDTGHYYMVVDYNAVGISNKSWGSAAFTWDSNSDYHLATSQTQVENDFIWGLIETFPDLSSSNPLSNNFKYWLGGFYNDGSAQTGGAGWYWIEDQGKF
jgi:hypothetical protein